MEWSGDHAVPLDRGVGGARTLHAIKDLTCRQDKRRCANRLPCAEALARKGLRVSAIYVSSLKDAEVAQWLRDFLARETPDVILNSTAFAARTAACAIAGGSVHFCVAEGWRR